LKHAIYLVAIIISVIATYQVTFAMTQEILGAIYIQGHIANYEVNSKIVNAIENSDIDRAKLLAKTIKNNEAEIVNELVVSLSAGNYTIFTDENILIGKDFLERINHEPVTNETTKAK